MRKLFVAASLAVALLFVGAGAESAKADHGFYGAGFGRYSNFGAPGCYAPHHAGFNGRFSGYQGYAHHYNVAPIYSSGIYQSYSFGGSPFGYPAIAPVGGPFGPSPFGHGAGFYGPAVPRVHLRVGF